MDEKRHIVRPADADWSGMHNGRYLGNSRKEHQRPSKAFLRHAIQISRISRLHGKRHISLGDWPKLSVILLSASDR